MMTMAACTARWQSFVRVRQRLSFVSELAGINISSILSLYNYSLTGVRRHDAFDSKCCRRTRSNDGYHVLPTRAHLVAVGTRAIRRRGGRNAPRDASTPYGSQRPLEANFTL